ncbi:hypothetical protein K458DRAFT_457276 [Lentithecium fluviatile CBS 122367]|uniref:RING-type domain-containing protein n=1 Tax=Lentithecium fluviatile CBS 122367 TaxID=1168545 RepID=A0A6G1ITC3_9PLEO|nr:hypothetical protein K458DRAFT_457276 [Lentithecium fluviatile CBS 122367]
MLTQPIRDIVGYTPLYQEFLDYSFTRIRDPTECDSACFICAEKVPKREVEREAVTRSWWWSRAGTKKLPTIAANEQFDTKPKTAKVKIVDCGRVFHTRCLMFWMKRHNTCPVYRGSLRLYRYNARHDIN